MFVCMGTLDGWFTDSNILTFVLGTTGYDTGLSGYFYSSGAGGLGWEHIH